jgi:thiamine biosynthesis lipoprotein
MRYHEFRAMNTEILLAAEGSVGAVDTGFKAAQKFIVDSERRFTRFSEDSELSRLNRSAGDWFEASQDLFQVVSQAVRMHQKTLGLFDPSILNALEQAGYDRTIEEVRTRTAGVNPVNPREIKPRQHLFSDIRLEPGNRRIWLPEDIRIDLGGIAKGWIAERAAILLSGWARTCAVDAGGDAFLIGLPEGEISWNVTLEDPCDPTQGLAILKLGPGAVATSAVTKRRWQQAGKMQHHLIDPRTCQPADTDWLSVTVMAPHLVDAEVYAKSLLIGGSRESSALMSLAGYIEFIAVDQQKKLWGSKHSREYLNV